MRKKAYHFLFTFILIFLFSCAPQKLKKIEIITSIFPIYDIVQNVTPKGVVVDFSIPEGANPHVFEPTPSLVVKIKNAKVFIGVHPGLDGWMEKYLNSDAKIIYLKDALPETENPHLWLSLRNTKKISDFLKDELIKIYPDQKKEILNNLIIFQNELKNLDKDLESKFISIKDKKIIQWHPAWNGFARDYGIEIVDSIQKGHGDKPSLKKMRMLIENAKKNQVHIVLIGLKVKSPALETLVKEINGKAIRVDGIGKKSSQDRNTYLKLMKYNGIKIFHALEGS